MKKMKDLNLTFIEEGRLSDEQLNSIVAGEDYKKCIGYQSCLSGRGSCDAFYWDCTWILGKNTCTTYIWNNEL